MHLSDRQWKTLAKDLQQQRCILLLGTRLSTAKDAAGREHRLSDQLSHHLATLLDAENAAYDRGSSTDLAYLAQRFLALPKMRRIDLEDEVSDFYARAAQVLPDIYQRLARLPFFLSINLSLEDFMTRSFRAAGKTGVQSLHYNFRKDRGQVVIQPLPEKPLVYNLLGTLADPESLVLSQEDHVEFIKNVVRGNPGIPNAVMSHFDNRKTYLFLGFNLGNWDYRLLCDALQLSKDNITLSPGDTENPLAPEARSFYEDHFQFLFIDDDIQQFVSALEKSFAEIEQEKTTVQRPAVLRKVVLLFARNEADTQGAQALIAHLSVWVQKGVLQIWHRNLPFVGDENRELQRRIDEADAVVSVLSADFLSDHLLMSEIMPEMLRQHNTRGLRLLPLLYRACDWEHSLLAPFPIIPASGQPLRNWSDADEAFKTAVEDFKNLLYE